MSYLPANIRIEPRATGPGGLLRQNVRRFLAILRQGEGVTIPYDDVLLLHVLKHFLQHQLWRSRKLPQAIESLAAVFVEHVEYLLSLYVTAYIAGDLFFDCCFRHCITNQ